MHKKIQDIEKTYFKKDIPNFNIGDTIQVHLKIKEEEKTRIQMFEGVVISKKGSSINQTFTVRKVSYGEGVERAFPLHSPNIDSLVVVKEGRVRRAKLYYLRKKIGKKSKLEEKDVYGAKETPPEDAISREKGED